MEFNLLKKVAKTDVNCPKHNIPLIAFGAMSPFCAECKKEELAEQEQQRVRQSYLRHHKRKTIEVLEKDSIVGDKSLFDCRFENYRTDNEETAAALDLAKIIAGTYSDRNRQFNTIFTGVPGVGKSHLAMSILQVVNNNADPFMSCLFISVNDLFRLIKDAISNKQSRYTEDNMVRLLSDVDLLVLDDLGSESSFKRENTEASEYNQRILFSILNARNRTIITTNLSSAELENIYNSKIVSRIYKGVEGHVIKFTRATKDKRSKIQF
ncbi:ATP-binding protein [Enterococcus saccharolyticus]|uniref:ATP-binding protein n=1 Tax=Enterococcus saccharolyticus TaxID=41997 RepID=UPI001E617402|nr:ATP-binding protein [Enterococcus saccharolyticus]MCD5001208.1 ATP-binding protein [Enterococcus saccharolyticus]